MAQQMAAIDDFLRKQDTLRPGKGDNGAVKEGHGQGTHGDLKL